MFLNDRVMKSNHILEKALDVESLRRKVISNNISNVDVPHFKRSEVNFESELKRAINQNEYNKQNQYPGLMSDKRHIPFSQMRDVTKVGPRVNLDYATSFRNDGNNVDIEKEMVDAAKNTMKYNSLVANLNHNYKMLKIAMKGA